MLLFICCVGEVQVSQLRKTGKLIMVTFVVRQSSVMHLWHHRCDFEIPVQKPDTAPETPKRPVPTAYWNNEQ